MAKEMHKLHKGPKHALDTDSSSDSSIYRSTLKLLETIKNDYESSLYNYVCQEEKSAVENQCFLESYDVNRCLILAKNLSTCLQELRERMHFCVTPRIRIYSRPRELRELQRYDNERRVLFSLAAKILPEVTGVESPDLLGQRVTTAFGLPSSELSSSSPPPAAAAPAAATTTTNTNVQSMQRSSLTNSKQTWTDQSIRQETERATDTIDKSTAGTVTQLADLLRSLITEWTVTVRCIQPIDPLEDKEKLYKNIRMDLDEINAWLSLLQSNLPKVSTWMNTLGKLTEVQRHSAFNYYQTKLHQVANHVHTLTTAKKLVLQASTSSADGPQMEELLQTISYLEAMCHVTWLQLLELIACLEHNFYHMPESSVQSSTGNNESRRYKSVTSKSIRFPRSESHNGTKPRSCGQKIKTRFQSCHIWPNPMEALWFDEIARTRLDKHDMKYFGTKRQANQTKMLSPIGPKGAFESGFESELSPQAPQYSYPRSSCHTSDWVGSPDNNRVVFPLRLRRYSVSTSNPVPKSVIPADEHQSNANEQCLSEPADRFVVLSVPADEPLLQPDLGGIQTITTQQHSDTTGGNLDQTAGVTSSNREPREEQMVKSAQDERADKAAPLQLSSLPPVRWIKTVHNSARRKVYAPRVWRGTHTSLGTATTRNSRSTPVLSTVPPIYRIMMRKPTRRLLLARPRGSKVARTVADQSKPTRPRLATGRVTCQPDTRLPWNSRSLTPRANKQTEADLEDLSTQDVSLRTTSSSGAAESKKPETSTGAAQFVLVRHKSRRPLAPLTRHSRRIPSRRRCNSVTWHYRSRRGTTALRPCPPIRAHSFCVPYSTGLDRSNHAIQGIHSDSSSVDGDASDPEYRLWQTRVKSYLDAAAKADALIRSQYGTEDVRSPLPLTKQHEHIGVGPHRTSSTDGSSPLVPREPKLTMSVGMEYQEPFMNFWDDYQAPLYSNSSDSDGCEPVSTYAEEFPWDDLAASCVSDASQEDVFLREIHASKPKSDFSTQLNSTVTTSDHAVDSAARLSTPADALESPVYRQDTMELSTSTSVLFNQKSSSLEASFEVCSPSATTGESNTVPTHESSDSQPNESELVCGLRTHPDGGSQHCLVGEAPTTPHHTSEDQPSRFLTVPGEEAKHNYLNRYLIERRKSQTLPRAAIKRRRAYKLQPYSTSFTTAHEDVDRPSSTASVDELCEWQERGLQLDILHFSKQRLGELRAHLHRLMQINPINGRTHCSSDTCESLTLTRWQNRLSHVIHLAEAHLQLLTDDTLGTTVCSTECACMHRMKTIQIPSNTRPLWSNCPELVNLQSQWIQFTDQARNWLLQSYSQEATQQQLTALKSRIYELNQTMQRVLATESINPEIRTSAIQTQTSEEPTGRSTSDTGSVSCSQDHLRRQIRQCVQEVEYMDEQVNRLREEFERHVRHVRERSRDPGLISTANFVTWRDENLVRELDELSQELSANQKRLNGWLTMQLNNPEDQFSSDDQEWEHVNYPIEFVQVSVQPAQESGTHSQILAESNVASEAESLRQPVVQAPPVTIGQYYPSQHVALLIGGLLAIACFSYYVITQVMLCRNQSCEWHVLLVTMEEILGRNTTRPNCPLQRERLSNLLDYTPGSVPF